MLMRIGFVNSALLGIEITTDDRASGTQRHGRGSGVFRSLDRYLSGVWTILGIRGLHIRAYRALYQILLVVFVPVACEILLQILNLA